MRTARIWILLALAGTWAAPALAEAEEFSSSLHATRAGKNHWYSAANGGFEQLTGVPIEKLGCRECHGPTDADGNPYPASFPGARCIDCHRSEDQAVSRSQCLGCHGRQAMESVRLELPDVHRDAGMQCWDCHGPEDMHGDGKTYRSLLEPGAVRADCASCHPASGLPAEHAGYDPHDGALHCAACHTGSVITCYNCHFESQVNAQVKRAAGALHGFVMLVNRTKDGKVYPATFQSLTFDGKSFVAFAPYTAHTITGKGRGCGECHVGGEVGGSNAAIAQYNETGLIRFAEWNPRERALDWVRGVVPIPEDYRKTLRMTFLTFDGDPATPAGKDKTNWSSIGKDTGDGSQMLFATPLSREQMDRLGFAPSPGKGATTKGEAEQG
jgi:hypothetical protein